MSNNLLDKCEVTRPLFYSEIPKKYDFLQIDISSTCGRVFGGPFSLAGCIGESYRFTRLCNGLSYFYLTRSVNEPNLISQCSFVRKVLRVERLSAHNSATARDLKLTMTLAKRSAYVLSTASGRYALLSSAEKMQNLCSIKSVQICANKSLAIFFSLGAILSVFNTLSARRASESR